MSEKCMYIGQTAIYTGPFRTVTDDDGHIYERGKPLEVCSDTAKKLKSLPFCYDFTVTEPKSKEGRACR
ncbi:MAG: hypothetical protein WA240_08265 [Nitrospirota bacterium]|nr:hypothetical protein [Nitrospinota bacterium]